MRIKELSLVFKFLILLLSSSIEAVSVEVDCFPNPIGMDCLLVD